MTHGIEIYLEQLSSVEVSKDGKTATIGGGTNAKVVTDSLWAAGKQTGKTNTVHPSHRFRETDGY